jgi:hypothetical protein
LTEGLVQIRLLRIPVDRHQEATEHSAEVMREFAHLADGAGSANVPARLIALDRIMQERFRGFTEATARELEEAIRRGDTEIDVTFEVPPEAGTAAGEVASMWDEVDRYCEDGRYLLALRTPPRLVTYRQWFLGEFTRQATGRLPTSWPEWASRESLDPSER